MFDTTIIRSAFRRSPDFQHPEDRYESWALLTVEEGVFYYELAGLESGEAHVGEVVFCPPGIVLRRRSLTPTLAFHFIEFNPQEAVPLSGKHAVADPARLRNTLSEFHALAASRDDASRLWMSHLLHDLIYQCLSRCRLSAATPSASDLLVEQVRKLLQENYQREDLSLAVVAHSFGLTPVQLARRFQSAYKQVPSKYVTGLRLDHAADLLLNTRMPLADIAQECGYRDPFYLSRVFKSAYGLAPAHYRQRHRI